MHRSRLLVLAPFAAAAACSQRKDTERFQGLKDDSTLVATLAYQNPDTNTDKPAFPEACGTFMIPSPAAADKARAEQIAQQAYSSEMIGNITEANAMLRRASSLDATDKNAAYHLGRTSEALGQRKAAIAAYCRYLALSPTKGEGAEARQRVRALSQSQTAVAAVTVRHPTRASRRTRAKASMSAVANGAIDLPPEPKPVDSPPPAKRRESTVVTEGDGAEVALPQSPVPQPQPQSRRASRVQTGGIGAVAGAIIGGVVGRSAKSTAIGAVAGGILGAIVPVGRSPSGFRK